MEKPITSSKLRVKYLKRYSFTCERTDIVSEPLQTSLQIAGMAKQFYGTDIDIYESFFCICLNRANRPVGYVQISQGGLEGTVVDMRMIMKFVLDMMPNGVVLVHNHPSGSTQPSLPDIKITGEIRDALEMHHIKLLDHVILTGDRAYYSFLDEGILPNLPKK